MRLWDYAGLPAAELDLLRNATRRLATLEDVIRWGLIQPEERLILEVCVQDEYTHDVVMQWREGRFLAFDTT